MYKLLLASVATSGLFLGVPAAYAGNGSFGGGLLGGVIGGVLGNVITQPAPAPVYVAPPPIYYQQRVVIVRPIDQQMVTVQRRLKELGFFPWSATVDGVGGPQTQQAIANWQHSINHMMTGNLSPDEVQVLFAPPPPPPAPQAQSAPPMPPLAANLVSTASPVTQEPIVPVATAQSPVNGVQPNQSYDVARSKILALGMKPVLFPRGATTCTSDNCHAYPETADCAGTGLGQCQMDFTAPDGKYLTVITIGEIPSVTVEQIFWADADSTNEIKKESHF